MPISRQIIDRTGTRTSRLPDKPRKPRDPERDAELAAIAAEVQRSYAAMLEEFPHHRAKIEADLAKRLRALNK